MDNGPLVFQFGNFKTLPIYSLMARTLESIDSLSKGQVAVEYKDPDYEPPPYRLDAEALRAIDADFKVAIQATQAWPHHFSAFKYFVQFKDDPSRSLVRALHCHTELLSTLCDARLAIDPSELWKTF